MKNTYIICKFLDKIRKKIYNIVYLYLYEKPAKEKIEKFIRTHWRNGNYECY